jgi:hypothetical protein
MKFTKVLILWIWIIVMPMLCQAGPVVKDFDENGIIGTGDYYDVVNIWDSAVVDMTDGTVSFCNCYNTSTLNLTGGDMFFVQTYDNSVANVEIDFLVGFELYDNSEVHLHELGTSSSIFIYDDS